MLSGRPIQSPPETLETEDQRIDADLARGLWDLARRGAKDDMVEAMGVPMTVVRRLNIAGLIDVAPGVSSNAIMCRLTDAGAAKLPRWMQTRSAQAAAI